MLRILTVLGTRPEAIKLAPVIRELSRHPGRVESIVVSTGQHRQMLDQVLGLFSLRPDRELSLMQADQSLTSLTASLLTALDRTYSDIRPDWVLAQGDTTTVLAAGLAAHYHRIRFGHVEAGLRSGNRWAPFPEEINRRAADLVADAWFAPTVRARDTLLREGHDPSQVHLTGNTFVDALLDVSSRPFCWESTGLPSLPAGARFVLVTAHRRESFGEPFRELCHAIRDLALSHAAEGVHFLYPVHLNPHVQRPVHDILGGLPNVHLLAPVDYLASVNLMKRATLILTDSGGIQEEAPSFGVPVLVMRETTERPEGVEAGFARLVGTSRERIVNEATAVISGHGGFAPHSGPSPYGDGHAAERIVRILLESAP
jgi:UDP-N-acetylglucosamine 2-epimerase (non-hydrolysing)